ncbi:hypothetical protein [Photobacterium lipolyticum]|uniref:hypothetical protein n=1 Tax=Photobacterium lipolyticum TaxID=266810 RepID=UPI0014753D9D|nr:hypothetical protein [Photobacterium lipolyticum]
MINFVTAAQITVSCLRGNETAGRETGHHKYMVNNFMTTMLNRWLPFVSLLM